MKNCIQHSKRIIFIGILFFPIILLSILPLSYLPLSNPSIHIFSSNKPILSINPPFGSIVQKNDIIPQNFSPTLSKTLSSTLPSTENIFEGSINEPSAIITNNTEHYDDILTAEEIKKKYLMENNNSIAITVTYNTSAHFLIDETIKDQNVSIYLQNREKVNLRLRIFPDFDEKPPLHNKSRPISDLFSVNKSRNPLNSLTQSILQNNNISPFAASLPFSPVYYELSVAGQFNNLSFSVNLPSIEDLSPNYQYFGYLFNQNTSEWINIDSLSQYSDGKFTINIPKEMAGWGELLFTITLEEVQIIPTPFNFLEILPWLIIGIILVVIATVMYSQKDYFSYLLARREVYHSTNRKMTMEKLLSNEKRRDIIEKIMKTPGIHFNELSRKCKISPGNLKWHLQILCEFQVIKKETIGKYNAYIPTYLENTINSNEIKVIQNPTALNIFQVIQNKPGINPNQIAEEIRIDNKTVSYHLNRLVEIGMVDKKRNGWKWALFPQDTQLFLLDDYFSENIH